MVLVVIITSLKFQDFLINLNIIEITVSVVKVYSLSKYFFVK
jgi:hypothetical protein